MGVRITMWVGFIAYGSAVAQVDFSRDIRPLLSDRCFMCHGPDATHRQAGLRFDIADGGLGKPEVQREVLRRIADTGADRMPPADSGKTSLTAREIGLVKTWVADGVKYRPFWSFVPPVLPTTGDSIDAFIRAKLQKEGLKPSPEAPRSLLIRRVSLDLTGVPPTLQEVEAFEKDTSPKAWEKVVDRLLASPRYGERMAFRWMEAARYGDSNGYQTDGPREMWRWRDWVIDAFNGNMPWSQFTLEQIAGDLLPNATREQKIATGFNRNHRTTGEGGIIDEEYRVEYVADRTQTTATIWMGLTLGCARCHDHKYDPLTQKDFYRLYAYFNQIPKEKGFTWNHGPEEPLVKAPTPAQEKKLSELDASVVAARKAVEALDSKQAAGQSKWERKPGLKDWTVTEGLVFRSSWVKSTRPEVVGPFGKAWQFDGSDGTEANGDSAEFNYLQPFTFSAWIKPEKEDGAILTRLDDYIESQGHGMYLLKGKVRIHVTQRFTDLGLRLETAEAVKLNQWQHVTVTYDGKRWASGVKIYVDGKLQPVKVLFDQNTEPFQKKGTPVRIGFGGGLRFHGAIGDARIYKRALASDEVAALAEPAADKRAKLGFAFLEKKAPKDVKRALANLKAAQLEREKFYDSIPTVMVMSDGAKRDTFLLKRGAYDAPGDPVSAGVPAILPQVALPQVLGNNDRLALARWLVDRQNPLTARVTVNRFWQSLFGTGIVKTVDDFGAQGEWPSHPELLDWLAVRFMDSNWDVKAIQKLMVMSATYRQASVVTPELLEKDPDNRLLARGPRMRLGPERIRDQALAVAGLLVEKVGGPSVKPYQPAGLWQELSGNNGYVQAKGDDLYRRSLYTYWKRTIPHPFMVNFDSPNREQCAVFENRTNSPLQALDLMNEITFTEASRKLAERMILEGGSTAAARLDYGYKLILARVPSAKQREVLLRTLANFEAVYAADPVAAGKLIHEGEAQPTDSIPPAQLAAYTGVASLMLNLDEAVTKE